MHEELVETWMIHARINAYVLEAVVPGGLTAVSASGGRTAGEQFAHMHNVRLMWLKQAAPDLLSGLEKVDKERAADAAVLSSALGASADAIAELLRRSLAGGGKVKGFRPHAAAFLGYLISHESHHRGQIALTLKQAGVALD